MGKLLLDQAVKIGVTGLLMLVSAQAWAQNPTDTTTPPPPKTEDEEVPSLFPSKYTPEPDKASDKKPTATWRWAGSDYFQQVGVSPEAFAPGLVQTYAPIVDTFVLLQPRYAITKDWQIRVRMTASYEFTDNANSSTTRSREFNFGDVSPQLAFLGIPKFAGIKTVVGLGVGLPTSPQSQERTMIVNPFLQGGMTKIFENALKGELSLGILAVYSHPFYQYTTGGLNNDPQYQPACFGASDSGCGLQATGAANVENSLTAGFTGAWQWGKFAVGVYWLLYNQWTYQWSPLPGVQTEPSGSQNFRQLSYLNVSLGWDFNDWFTAEIGYQMYRTILTGESTYGNPVFDPYQDMRVYAGATFHLDKLYDAVRGQKDKEGPFVQPVRKLLTSTERNPTL